MKAENYIQIQGWMIINLNLTGNLLLTYALIYGFSQDGNSEFTGSINYVCKWLNCSRPTAIKVLKELTEKGLIEKTQVEVNNVTFNKYSANLISAGSFGGSKESLPLVKKLNKGSKETLLGGSKETLPNNTIYNNTKEKNIYTPLENKISNPHYSPEAFLKRWADARRRYDKKPTNIQRLNGIQKSLFSDLIKFYNARDFDMALKGFFEQNTYASTRVNPTHFMENFEQYLTCGESGEKLFEGKKSINGTSVRKSPTDITL